MPSRSAVSSIVLLTLRKPAATRCVLRDALLRSAPHDEGDSLATSEAYLILRRPQSGRLEGRTGGPQVPVRVRYFFQKPRIAASLARKACDSASCPPIITTPLSSSLYCSARCTNPPTQPSSSEI